MMKYQKKNFILQSYDLLHDINTSLWQMKSSHEQEAASRTAHRIVHAFHDSASLHNAEHITPFTAVMVAILEKVVNNQLRLSDELLVILLEVSKQIGILLDYLVDDDEVSTQTEQYSQRLMAYLNNYLCLEIFDIKEQQEVDEWLQFDWQLSRLKSFYGLLPAASYAKLH